MDLKVIMAANLRRVRHEKDLTQEELAHRAGLSSRYIGNIERETVSSSVTVLGKLAAALDIDPCDLLKPLTKRRSATRDGARPAPRLSPQRNADGGAIENAVAKKPKKKTRFPV